MNEQPSWPLGSDAHAGSVTTGAASLGRLSRSCRETAGAEAKVSRMKKLLLLAAALAGAAAWRKMQADKAEQDLWAEATDKVR